MGIYLFRTDALVEVLKGSEDDFGSDIIPKMLETHAVFAYPYRRLNRIEDYIEETSEEGDREMKLEKRTRDSSYWRDVGTVDDIAWAVLYLASDEARYITGHTLNVSGGLYI